MNKKTILILMGLVAVGSAGFYFYNKNKNKNTIDKDFINEPNSPLKDVEKMPKGFDLSKVKNRVSTNMDNSILERAKGTFDKTALQNSNSEYK